jgi:hypothetical protein
MTILQKRPYISPIAVLWFRIRMDPHQIVRQDPDPHHSNQLDPDPHPVPQKMISGTRICINLQNTSQNLWNMSPFKHFSKVLSLYMEARIEVRIRIRIKVKGRIRIKVTSRIRGIKVTSRIRIRIKVMRIRNTA